MSSGEVKEKALPLKGKYDGRRFNGQPQSVLNSGPISRHYKNLSRTTAVQTLKALDSIASLAQIYSLAFQRSELSLCVQIRENVANRAFGKPFVAVNPDEQRKPSVLNDNRLQIAVQQLLPGAKRTGKRTVKLDSKPAKLLTTQEGNENHIFSSPEPCE